MSKAERICGRKGGSRPLKLLKFSRYTTKEKTGETMNAEKKKREKRHDEELPRFSERG